MQPNACAVKRVKDDMMGKGDDGQSKPRGGQKDLPPVEILDVIYPALQIGGLSGMSGVLIGAFAGIIRSQTPVLFALASGIQWFALGSAFTATRGLVLNAWGGDKVTPRDRISASAIAGGVSGTVGGLLRGPRNIIPGALMFAVFGAAGQGLYNRADAVASESAEMAAGNRMNSWLNSKWSPMRPLSSSEYENIMREKLLRVNADIALVDENIEALRARERSMEAKNIENQATSSKSK